MSQRRFKRRTLIPLRTEPESPPVIRTLYALSVVALVSGTAWSATGMQGQRLAVDGGVGLVLLAALQR